MFHTIMFVCSRVLFERSVGCVNDDRCPCAHCRYIPVRYIQAMGTFGYAEQFYRTAMRFYFGSSKEVCVCVCVLQAPDT